MKKIITTDISGSIGMPLKSGSIDHIQSAYQEALNGIAAGMISAFMPGNFSFQPLVSPQVFCLKGASNFGAASIPASILFYQGEIFYVDAVSVPIVAGQTRVWQITTNYFLAANADPVEFSDGNNRSVHEIRKMTVVNVPNPAPNSNLVVANTVKLQNDGAVFFQGTGSTNAVSFSNVSGSFGQIDMVCRQTGKVINYAISGSFQITAVPAPSPGTRAFIGWSLNSMGLSAFESFLPTGTCATITLRKQGTNDFIYAKWTISESAQYIELCAQFPSIGSWIIDGAPNITLINIP